MCDGLFFLFNDEFYRVYFSNPDAVLPVLRRDGNVALLPWGRRKDQAGALPLGGWARLDSLYVGRWDRWFPKPVKIHVSSFMEKDIAGKTCWYDVTKGKFIQGVVAREGTEQRAYIVTLEPERSDAEHERWPRILSG